MSMPQTSARVLAVMLASVVGVGAALAGDVTPAPAPQDKPAPGKAPRPTPAPEPEESRTERGQLANIQFEVTITEQRGDHAPVQKAVTLTVADRGNGFIRAEGKVGVKDHGFENLRLGVDLVRPQIEGNRVRLQLAVSYDTLESNAPGQPPLRSEVRHSLNVVLESGKPMLLAQSADPTTDRRVSLQAKATILK